MNEFAVKKSNILTQYDIDNLLNRFGGKTSSYIEIVDVQKNNQIIEKYPLLSDVSRSCDMFDIAINTK
ncbi:MAG: BcsR/BcsP family cellulose biosynthesis protein [Pseudoalteromonas sp.]|uniref:BcsR/BcsP family cellulose biosynthesis protein n=1 Tax=unclassified Pseudoalteromonas TaxID=194690 RepID=UPI000C067F19|nr:MULTISPECIES: BcsR/BcsP family cellulose biosynthesis protein [unclassified Pseudoalteromonas]MDP2635259.1 hypothetical protein [Pseudoalteromonas sp. 1_MG-2023]PHN90920.1 hypothetical protein CSC79_04615 [Pseudoalteromonas sp. 3D05]TGE84253.1 hypothetical protein C7Y70_07270 [Pseudoalteromonas sp. KS88]